MEVAYEPEKLFARYQHQCDYTYTQRIKVPVTPEQKSWANIKRGLIMLRNIFWKVGVLGDYRRVFWKFALGRLRRGDIEGLIGSALIAHHLIMFARAASAASRTRRTIRSGCARPRSLPSAAMKTPAPPSRSLGDLRALTPARVGARPRRREPADRGAARLHARPRARPRRRSCRLRYAGARRRLGAVSAFRPVEVSSRAGDRRDYLRRPDLGRMLDAGFDAVRSRSRAAAPSELAIVIGDGLSPAAVNRARGRTGPPSWPRLAEARHRDRPRRGRIAARAWRWATRSARYSARGMVVDADRRAAGPVGARQSRRLSDLRAAASASPMPSAIASPTFTAPGSATRKPPSRSRG